MNFLLKGLRWMKDEEIIRTDIRIRNGFIHEIRESLKEAQSEQTIHFNNHYVYAGLINSHDHLEMNLYPRLGNPPYVNYKEWGEDIYKPTLTPIREIERIDINDRLLWGGLKNLISGVTTVVHHNPWKKILGTRDFPVKVLSNLGWAHSLAFGKNIKAEFLKKPGAPFVIHAAEGVDVTAFDEIRQLDQMGVLQNNTVLIHGIALNPSDIELLQLRKCSLVWCPASNEFLFGRTADISSLKKNIRVTLGSDSTLTGSPTLLDEMRCALQTGLASIREIHEMVTQIPARIFQLPAGGISIGASADFMIVPALHEDYFENLFRVDPSRIEAVFINGKPCYGDEGLAHPLKLNHSFSINGISKCSNLDVATLRKRLLRKAGSQILNTNSLWQIIND